MTQTAEVTIGVIRVPDYETRGVWGLSAWLICQTTCEEDAASDWCLESRDAWDSTGPFLGDLRLVPVYLFDAMILSPHLRNQEHHVRDDGLVRRKEIFVSL